MDLSVPLSGKLPHDLLSSTFYCECVEVWRQLYLFISPPVVQGLTSQEILQREILLHTDLLMSRPAFCC